MYLKDNVPKEIPIHIHNEPNYDYHFIIKEFVGELEEKIALLGKNTEKYVTFSIPIEKKVARIDKKMIRNHKSHIWQIFTIYYQWKIYNRLVVKYC